MKVLHIAAGLPSEERPQRQPFIKSQIESLTKAGVYCGIYDIESNKSKMEYFKSISKIKKKVLEEKYDILHAHYSYCGLVSYFSSTGKPIVLSLMGSDLLGSPNIDGKITARGKVDIYLSRFISERVDHIIVKSVEMQKSLKSNIESSVVPNGVNFDKFVEKDQKEVRKKLGISDDQFVILFLGSADIPRKNYKLAKESVENMTKILGDKKIELINPYGISHDKVIDYLSAANVLLLTSYWEGSPNVVKEAMACNLPIISTDVGDVKDLIEGATNCFLVDFSIDEISDNLIKLYNNRERSNGREIISYLRDDIIANKIIQIYESLK